MKFVSDSCVYSIVDAIAQH